ncbi:hypothetical protein CPB83DRAFT_738929, partial [Crepidotus variabilis]
MCVTGLSVQHVGEQFQRSNETISHYFRLVLDALSSGPFYAEYVKLPLTSDPASPVLQDNSKFWPFFQHVLGAIDSTHINCCPSALERQMARDRK